MILRNYNENTSIIPNIIVMNSMNYAKFNWNWHFLAKGSYAEDRYRSRRHSAQSYVLRLLEKQYGFRQMREKGSLDREFETLGSSKPLRP